MSKTVGLTSQRLSYSETLRRFTIAATRNQSGGLGRHVLSKADLICCDLTSSQMKIVSFSRDTCRQSLDLRRNPKQCSEAKSILRAFCRDLRSVGKAGAVTWCFRFVEKRYLILHNVRSGAHARNNTTMTIMSSQNLGPL